VTDTVDVAVVGAGPYGLSVAASVASARAIVFGQPLLTWQRMEPDMELRAAWDEMALVAGGGRGGLDAWLAETGRPRREPMTPADFVAYGTWFRQRFVPEFVEDDVEIVEPEGALLRVAAGGSEWLARRLVVAVGITPFPYLAPQFARLGDERVEPAALRNGFADLADARVAVVGGGQSAVEAAAHAARAGASVTMLVRGTVTWFADREPHTPRGWVGQRLYRLAYPVVGYGPPPINRLVRRPDAFAALPFAMRRRLTNFLLRPGASPWLQPLVEGRVDVREHVEVRQVECGEAALRLHLSGGEPLEVDRLIVGTGFRFALERLPFLSVVLRERIQVSRDWPVLDRSFRSTDPSVFFVGYAAEGRFGPVARFVLGVPFTAKRVAAALRGHADGR
jgi:FAD-dependent urate hydroxylase